MEKIVIVGLGLIGGSMALDLKKRGSYQVFGIDHNKNHVQKAIDLEIIDAATDFPQLKDASVVIVAVPVNAISKVVQKVLDHISEDTLVFDVGSVKKSICNTLDNHPKRKNFVAAHPLAGTEFSGPEAAIYNLFDDKVTILCDVSKTNWKILDKAISLFKLLNMRIKMMEPDAHDRHIAYVSHLSHVSSFMLGKTVLEIEKNEEYIFDMASTGFASTVRLAKSSAAMWSPIFIENKENVIRSLNEYIKNLNAFKTMIENNDEEALTKTMNSTNYIKTILNGIE
ncbi:prephenate dehydrogenase [Lutibacter sp.]